MRTAEEIAAMLVAAEFKTVIDVSKRPAIAKTTKGSPPILVCIEQAMTLHLHGKRIALPLVGPIARMACALHLNLTPEEAEAAQLTAAAAQADCEAAIVAVLREAGVDVGPDDIDPIPPHDPRWGRCQPVKRAKRKR